MWPIRETTSSEKLNKQHLLAHIGAGLQLTLNDFHLNKMVGPAKERLNPGVSLPQRNIHFVEIYRPGSGLRLTARYALRHGFRDRFLNLTQHFGPSGFGVGGPSG